MRTHKKTGMAFAAFLAVCLVSCVAKTPAIKTDNSIAQLEKVKLGGVEQWILVRGENRSNPVLLFVHGGPGSPETPLEYYFGRGLEKNFVVVMWDQRNAGKSVSFAHPVPKSSMNIDQFVSDALELTQILEKKFNTPKIYIMGHSWGTIIGTLAVQRRPELFYAYIGIGQCVDLKRDDEISYQFVLDEAKKQNNQKAIKQLEEIGPPPYKSESDLMTQRGWLDKFHGVFWKGSMNDYILKGLHAQEYNTLDFVKFVYGAEYSGNLMWKDLTSINFIQQAPRLLVPVYFFEGRHDYNTSWPLVQEYYEKLDAPKGKHLIWFENSAHSPNLEETDKFTSEMVNEVLPQTYNK